jgi:two-component system chemotaxis response regulator CheB
LVRGLEGPGLEDAPRSSPRGAIAVTLISETPVSAPAPPVAVVALAASAGGLAALREVLSALPADFPAPVVVVQHLDRKHRSLMASILARCCRLPVKQAEHGELLRPGMVYIAVPDYHLLVNADSTLALTRSELVHYVRPSADLLFTSAAAFGDRTVAVVLSGTGSDGDAGVRAVKRAGGTVIAQDPATSEFIGMPAAAISTGSVDLVLPLSEVAPALVALTKKAKMP